MIKCLTCDDLSLWLSLWNETRLCLIMLLVILMLFVSWRCLKPIILRCRWGILFLFHGCLCSLQKQFLNCCLFVVRITSFIDGTFFFLSYQLFTVLIVLCLLRNAFLVGKSNNFKWKRVWRKNLTTHAQIFLLLIVYMIILVS